METKISTASPDAGGSATPTGTDTPANGNGQPGGEASSQGAAASETFIPKGVDLNTLPPQVRAYVEEVNKQMVRGFTEKTTKLSETVKSEAAKATEAIRQKAEFYDQIAKEESFVKQWNDYVKKASQPDPNADPVQQKLTEIERKQAEMDMKVRTAETLEVINAFADAKDDKGNLIHPDFDKLSGFKIGEHAEKGQYDLLRASIELAPGDTPAEKMENGYKAAQAVYNEIFEEGKKAGMGRLSQKVRNGSMAPSGSANVGGTAPRAPKNAQEALEFARQGLAPFKG